MDGLQSVAVELVAQASLVVLIVALLRLALRRVFKVEPDADGLLALNLAANIILTGIVALQQGANFADPQTLGGLAILALSATVGAHGGYDFVTNRAKGGGSASQTTNTSTEPGDYPPGAPSIAALGLPDTSEASPDGQQVASAAGDGQSQVAA